MSLRFPIWPPVKGAVTKSLIAWSNSISGMISILRTYSGCSITLPVNTIFCWRSCSLLTCASFWWSEYTILGESSSYKKKTKKYMDLGYGTQSSSHESPRLFIWLSFLIKKRGGKCHLPSSWEGQMTKSCVWTLIMIKCGYQKILTQSIDKRPLWRLCWAPRHGGE